MSRNLKRVPLEFAWPMEMVWKGYICPYQSQDCSVCDRTGLRPEAKQISDDWYDFAGTGRRWCDKITQDECDALLEDGRLVDLVRQYGKENVTAEIVNGQRGGVHDAINSWICRDQRLRRLGLYDLRNCPVCEGAGRIWFSDRVKELDDRWYDEERYDPPAGDGYQLWENVSEGSPVSPVFSTLEALCDWCADNATTFSSFKATTEEWFNMLSPGGLVYHQEGRAVFM